MDTTKVYLRPEQKWVEAVTEWLSQKARKEETGALSFAHLLIVVPTRQAGRRLRFQLAKRNGALIPPSVMEPMQLALLCCSGKEGVAVDGTKRASDVEANAVLMKMLTENGVAAWPTVFPKHGTEKGLATFQALGVTQQLCEVWNTLAQNGLTMADVAENPKAKELWAKDDVGTEEMRWHELSGLEAAFFRQLHALGLHHRNEDVKRGMTAVPSELEGLQEIILPGIVDPTPVMLKVLGQLGLPVSVLLHAKAVDAGKFDEWGRPKVESWTDKNAPLLPLDDAAISLAADSTGEAKLAAQLFSPDASLGMADSDLYPALESAFLEQGIAIHSPEKHPLRVSSLGRIIKQLVVLLQGQADWNTFFAFLHNDDVLSWLCPETRSQVLDDADKFQNNCVPLFMPDLDTLRKFRFVDADNQEHAIEEFPKALEKLEFAFRAAEGTLFERLTSVLRKMYGTRRLFKKGQEKGDREFAAAVAAAMQLIDEMSSDAMRKIGLNAEEELQLFETGLDSVNYQLQPESDDVVETEGWLELMWCPSDNLLVTGFNEGIVPESIVSHPFLPNSLRAALGLQNNEQRLARDTFLLNELLLSHPKGAINILLSQVDDMGDIRKPSRLLFLCEDGKLPSRAQQLFKNPEAPSATPARQLPEAWKLNPPIPQNPPKRLSPSALDAYLKCPFTYYLQKRLHMEAIDTGKQELGFDDFGSLCHELLRQFSVSPAKDSDDENEIYAAVSDLFYEEKKKRYGKKISTVFHMQLEAVTGRLRHFAKLQALQRQAGWKIFRTEFDIPDFCIPGIALPVTGRIDRIDRNEDGKYCVIDYKTWDAKKADEKIFRTKKKQLDEMRARHLPLFKGAGEKAKEESCGWMSVQLPFYGMILESLSQTDLRKLGLETSFKRNLHDFRYCLLGKSEEESVWYNGTPLTTMECLKGSGAIFANYENAQETVWKLVDQLMKGIFWPPSVEHEKDQFWDYKPLFLNSPLTDVNDDWTEDQANRLSKEEK